MEYFVLEAIVRISVFQREANVFPWMKQFLFSCDCVQVSKLQYFNRIILVRNSAHMRLTFPIELFNVEHWFLHLKAQDFTHVQVFNWIHLLFLSATSGMHWASIHLENKTL